MSKDRSIGTKRQREEEDDNDAVSKDGNEDYTTTSSDYEEKEGGIAECDSLDEEEGEEDVPSPPQVVHLTPLLLPVLEIKEVKPKKEKKGARNVEAPPAGPPSTAPSATMCAFVAELFRNAPHFAYIRSAGRRGYDAWGILAAAGRAPLCVDALSCKKPTAKQVREGTISQLVPLGLLTLKKHPSSKFKAKKNGPEMAVIVVFLGPLEERKWLTKFNIRDARRFRFVGDPKSEIVSLPSGTQFSQMEDVSIEVTGGDNVTTIESDCLAYTSSISDVTINLPNLSHIEDDFCIKCHCLRSLKINSLQNVTTIGDQFLAGCGLISALDLSEMKSVASIGDRFMVKCTSLRYLNLSGMSKITDIGDSFLYACAELISVDFPKKLTGATKNIDMPETFMSFCRGLKGVDLTWMGDASGGTSHEFLLDCNSLETVNLAPFSKATEIENDFLSCTSSLKTINLSPLKNVRIIGDSFLSGSGIERIDLGPLVAVEVIGTQFLCSDEAIQFFDDLRLDAIRRLTKAQRMLPENSIESCYIRRRPFSTIRCNGSPDLSGLNSVVLAALRLSGFKV